MDACSPHPAPLVTAPVHTRKREEHGESGDAKMAGVFLRSGWLLLDSAACSDFVLTPSSIVEERSEVGMLPSCQPVQSKYGAEGV